jgi:hypothetical protein
MRTFKASVKCVAMKAIVLSFVLLLSCTCSAQNLKMPGQMPITAGDLKEFCKSFQLMSLELEKQKQVDWKELNESSICVGFIMGVISTVGATDVGYFPQFKYVIADAGSPTVAYKTLVESFMKHLSTHPEHEKESAASVVLLALMEDKMLIPQKWEQSSK